MNDEHLFLNQCIFIHEWTFWTQEINDFCFKLDSAASSRPLQFAVYVNNYLFP